MSAQAARPRPPAAAETIERPAHPRKRHETPAQSFLQSRLQIPGRKDGREIEEGS
jgi:hypothetical protein